MKVEAIQVSWSDNWMYLITDDATKEAAVVDPWDAEGISQRVKAAGVNVSTCAPRPIADGPYRGAPANLISQASTAAFPLPQRSPSSLRASSEERDGVSKSFQAIGPKAEVVQVKSVITTHHHNDHSGGNDKFVSLHPGTTVYGGSKKGQGVDHVVKDGDTFTIGTDIDVK